MRNADKVAAWRREHPSERLTAVLLWEIIGRSLSGTDLHDADLHGADLRGAKMRGADLRWTDLCGANLYGADLYGADLYAADLRGADLRGADLSTADLYSADLRHTDLCGADLRGARVTEPCILSIPTPSGWVTLVPSSLVWELRVGCWAGTPDTLRTLIAGDDWPEAEGSERDRRRPILAAVADICDAHVAYYGSNPLGVLL